MMKVSEERFVGISLSRACVGRFPLAFSIPVLRKANGTLATATKKRMETVKSWLNRGEKECLYVENIPKDGFKIVDYVSRYSTSNKLFRVQDPNGYELEISCENMLELMKATTIKNGVIQEPCLWTDACKLVTTKQIKDAEIAELKAQKAKPNYVDPKTITKGSTICIKATKEEVVYLGRVYWFYFDADKAAWHWSSSKKYLYECEAGYVVTNKLDVLKVTKKKSLSDANVQELINKKLEAYKWNNRNPIKARESYNVDISMLSVSKPKDTDITFKWLTVDEPTFEAFKSNKGKYDSSITLWKGNNTLDVYLDGRAYSDPVVGFGVANVDLQKKAVLPRTLGDGAMHTVGDLTMKTLVFSFKEELPLYPARCNTWVLSSRYR